MIEQSLRIQIEKENRRMEGTMTKLTIDNLNDRPYTSILCYPREARQELNRRKTQLKRLGITAVEFSGPKKILGTHVLGKGCVGIVTIAHKNEERVALKIRRIDADRQSMWREAQVLKKANAVEVGPKLLDVGKNFLIMQFIEGDLFPEWLEGMRSRERTKNVLRSILEQCWRLDEIGLDHGELSHAPKHIIIDKKDTPFIVDFESASIHRRPANVTSIYHFLFISRITKENSMRMPLNQKSVIKALRDYKGNMNIDSFRKVMESCGL